VIVVVPAETPVKTPEAEPILAIAVLALAHNPGVEASISVLVLPAQTTALPVIAAGNALTVIVAADVHPVGRV